MSYCDDDDEYDDLPADECDHDEYEIDILTGRADCCYCQHSWWVTENELSAEIQRQSDCMAEMDAEEAKEPEQP